MKEAIYGSSEEKKNVHKDVIQSSLMLECRLILQLVVVVVAGCKVCRKHSWTLPEHVYNYCYITENCFVCIAQCDIT